MASPHIHLDSTLGAAFLGNLAAAIFYGITCVQTFIYFKKNYRDTTAFRLLIFFLWLIDTFHLALITHGLYYYLISNYGNLVVIASPTWSIVVQVYVTIISDGIIRAIFGRRVWLITERNKFIAAAIFLTSAFTCVSGIIFATRVFAVGSFANFSQISYLLYMALGGGVVADILIAGSLCISLSRTRTGFKQTDSIVVVLMMYTINTSLLTTVCSAACFITYAIWPREFTFIGIYFSLSKRIYSSLLSRQNNSLLTTFPAVFLNSLLATLNSRDSLKGRLAGVSGVALSDVSSSRRFEYSKSAYDSRHSQPVVVTVNRRVEVEDSESTRSPTATYFSKKIGDSPPYSPGGESSKSEVGYAY
ncbi:hypothetical protein BDZ94DRAFT_575659 [Collybia nuda]|uniref:DUF6534 domain-containing protein n=1 Tax=Collybia nuda TaxID=64659 RepID=A0A9P5Y826_9AGAR|nr:hypothetical protein BDZ94DRAFT_575659 [Collybia nuda]